MAFDSSGEAYLFCLAFNRAPPASDVQSAASALVLFRSANGGASWNLPASIVKQDDGTGATWNLVPGISGTSPELCPANVSGAPAGTCDSNQFPLPFTAPTATCTWSSRTSTTPSRATTTGHDPGRSCVPTAPLSDRSIFRATNYPSAVATSDRRIVVTLGSYLNRHGNPERGTCSPAGFNPRRAG